MSPQPTFYRGPAPLGGLDWQHYPITLAVKLPRLRTGEQVWDRVQVEGWGFDRRGPSRRAEELAEIPLVASV